MSVTQDYKNVQLSPDEVSVIYDALISREPELAAEIADNEESEWHVCAAKGREQMGVLKRLIERLEVL